MVAGLLDALQDHPAGSTIRVEVAATSRRVVIPSGYNPWRQAVEVRLTEPAIRGRANHQLVEEMAAVLGVPMSSIVVIGGLKSSRKVVLLRGLSREDACRILEGRRPE